MRSDVWRLLDNGKESGRGDLLIINPDVGKHPLFCVLGVQTQNSVLQEDYGKNLKEIGFLEVAPAKGASPLPDDADKRS